MKLLLRTYECGDAPLLVTIQVLIIHVHRNDLMKRKIYCVVKNTGDGIGSLAKYDASCVIHTFKRGTLYLCNWKLQAERKV